MSRLDSSNSIVNPFQMVKKISSINPSQLSLPKLTLETLLNFFPFGITINNEMRISGAGVNLVEAWKAASGKEDPNELLGSLVLDCFKLRRPTGISFNFETVREVQFYLVGKLFIH